MSDLEILATFRLVEEAGTIYKFTKSVHSCQDSQCDSCIAKLACRQLVNDNRAHHFNNGYAAWAKRTPFLSLSELQQQYPELFI